VDTLARFHLDDDEVVRFSSSVGAVERLERVAHWREGEVERRLAPFVDQLLGAIDTLDLSILDADADEAAFGVGKPDEQVRQGSRADTRSLALQPLPLGRSSKPFHPIVVRKESELLKGELLKACHGGMLSRTLKTLDLRDRSDMMTTFATFVDATDLKQWADRRTAQETLPELVGRLVHATAPSASRISFRAGEGVQLGGWDGLVTAHAATAFVPAGESGWSLGVEKPVLGKARSDFEARRDGGGMLTPETSTFVFVTPRRFRDKDTWAADATRDTPWRLVKAYDADDLASWLEQSPAVHAWISAELGKLPRGIRSLDDVWAAWAQGTLPPFPPGLAIAGRDAEAEEVAAWLTGQPAAHAIRADTVDEGPRVPRVGRAATAR